MASHQRFQRFTLRRQNNHRIGGQPGIATSRLNFRFVMPRRRRFDSCFVAGKQPRSDYLRTFTQAESQLPLGGTSVRLNESRSKGLGLIGRPGADARPRTAGWRTASMRRRRRSAAHWPLPVGPVRGRLASWGSSRPRPLYKRSHVALKTVPSDLRAVPAVWARLAARD